MSEVNTPEEVVTVEAVKRADLAKSVAELYEMPISLADKILQTAFEEIAEAVSLGKVVSIHQFGKFRPVTRAARTARNPKTGEAVEVGEKSAIKFSPALSLKKAMQE